MLELAILELHPGTVLGVTARWYFQGRSISFNWCSAVRTTEIKTRRRHFEIHETESWSFGRVTQLGRSDED